MVKDKFHWSFKITKFDISLIKLFTIICATFLSKHVFLLGLLNATRHMKMNVLYFIIAAIGFIIAILFSEFQTALLLIVTLVLSLYNLDRLKKSTSDNLCITFPTPFFIASSVFVFLTRDGHLIFNIDKNVFTILYVFIICWVSYHRKLTLIEISLMVIFSFMVGSTNFIIFVLLITGAQFFNFTYRGSLILAFILSNIIAILYVAAAYMLFDFNNPTSLFFPASVIERGLALVSYIEFISVHGLPLHVGNFSSYSDSVITYVHNDLLKLIVQHGLIYTIFITYLQLRFMSKLTFQFSSVFAVYLYSGILGGMGWFGGNMLILTFITLTLMHRVKLKY